MFPIFNNFSGSQELGRLLQTYAESPEIAERAVRWRHYGIGASLGYALRFFWGDKNWKTLLEKEEVSLFEILEADLPLESHYDRFIETLAIYNYPVIKEAVAENVRQYQRRLNDIETSYKKVEGVEVSITSPQTGISGQGIHEKPSLVAQSYSFNVSLQDSSVLASSDQTWRLQLTDQPYVFQTNGGAREFKCEDTAEVTLDGQKLSLAQAMKTPRNFNSIEIKGKKTEFTSKGNPGQLLN